MLSLLFRVVDVMVNDLPYLSNKCGIDLLIGIGYLWSSGVTASKCFLEAINGWHFHVNMKNE